MESTPPESDRNRHRPVQPQESPLCMPNEMPREMYWAAVQLTTARAVVRVMVSQVHVSEINNTNNYNNKIPEYARDYKKEWLFIRGINKSCEMLIIKIVNSDYSDEKIFSSPGTKALVRDIKIVLAFERMGKLQNISELKFKLNEINEIECLQEELDNYRDLYVDPDSYKFDEESYEKNIDKDFPGFREIFDVISLFNDKIRRDEEEYIGSIFQSDESDESESESDESESEGDDKDLILPGNYESDESESEGDDKDLILPGNYESDESESESEGDDKELILPGYYFESDESEDD